MTFFVYFHCFITVYTPMRAFLKCYYGYHNRGDELLFFGVCKYILQNFDINKIYVEVGDELFFAKRLKSNIGYFDIDSKVIIPISKSNISKYNLSHTMKFFGGGEVLNDEIEIGQSEQIQQKFIEKSKRVEKKNIGLDLDEITNYRSMDLLEDTINKISNSKIYNISKKFIYTAKQFGSKYFARAGRNYFVSYFHDIQKGNFVLLGGVTTPHKATTRFLYKKMLPMAKSIICREKTSFELCSKYNKKTILFQDFGLYAMKYLSENSQILKKNMPKIVNVKKKYVLINIHRKVRNENTLEKIETRLSKYQDCQKIFFVADIGQDKGLFEELQNTIPDLILYKWTEFDIASTLSIFKFAKAGIGARLHFLLPLRFFGIELEKISYSEKIDKLI